MKQQRYWFGQIIFWAVITVVDIAAYLIHSNLDPFITGTAFGIALSGLLNASIRYRKALQYTS